jgi:hypothetical protein
LLGDVDEEPPAHVGTTAHGSGREAYDAWSWGCRCEVCLADRSSFAEWYEMGVADNRTNMPMSCEDLQRLRAIVGLDVGPGLEVGPGGRAEPHTWFPRNDLQLFAEEFATVYGAGYTAIEEDRPVRDELPVVHAPRGGINYYFQPSRRVRWGTPSIEFAVGETTWIVYTDLDNPNHHYRIPGDDYEALAEMGWTIMNDADENPVGAVPPTWRDDVQR